MKCKTIFFLVLIFSLIRMPVQALEPDEILVVANTNAAKSKGLARYYMKKRQIPNKNLVLLFMTDKETCSREEYEKKAIPPIRRFLDENTGIRAIVTVFGVPLRISGPEKNQVEASKVSELAAKKRVLEEDMNSVDKVAAFDSELALVKKDGYELNMWLPNPYYLGFRGQKLSIDQSEVLMTSRLDGATEEVVKRIIDDSIEAERTGLKGKIGRAHV